MFSKTCEYAIRASLYLALHIGQTLRADEIAHAIGAPLPITGKTLQILAKRSLILSVKGPNGGYVFTEGHKQVTLHNVVSACDGDALFSRCFIGLDKCNSQQPCPLHEDFVKVRKRILRLVDSKTVLQFSKQMRKDGTLNLNVMLELRKAAH
jgi:Rrf2 family iron-sulfur cluster assembly transcriptional regulator